MKAQVQCLHVARTTPEWCGPFFQVFNVDM